MTSAFWQWKRSYPLLIFVLLVAVVATYSNHFHNSFHFDDAHTVVDNPSIRTLKNLPKFFTDAKTFSVLPSNRTWRPLVSLSLALDYWAGNGLSPVAFHISTFFWYLLELALLFLLFERIFDAAWPHPSNRMLAFLAAALYGLHPACAETVNYIIQRGDLYSTLGVVAGLWLFAARPDWRRYGVYLIPVAAAQISKPPALIFPALLFIYIYLFEETGATRAFRVALPALILSAAMGWLQAGMTPPTFVAGAYSAARYRITQPYVALRYFENFFLPIRLSADSDLAPLDSAWQPEALLGFGFVAALAFAAILSSSRRRLRPVAFGLWWYLLALAPTSLFPLAEVENDHRMFFPFIGLALGLVWALALGWRRLAVTAMLPRILVATCAVGLLAACAYGTYRRNQVWRDETSLWRDVTEKSPRNGRGLMNFGLTLMAKGDIAGALEYFQRALIYTPNYSILEINLGVAESQAHHDAEAERHFERAVALASQDAQPYFYYARWLDTRGRTGDALLKVQQAVALNPSNLEAQNLALRLQTAATPASLLDLSLRYHRAGRYDDCIRAARDALKLKADYAEAYNNIAAAYESLRDWDQAIGAARQALRIKPDFALARNNLAWSEAQKALTAR